MILIDAVDTRMVEIERLTKELARTKAALYWFEEAHRHLGQEIFEHKPGYCHTCVVFNQTRHGV